MELRRRDFLRTGAVAAGALAFGPGFWRQALAAPAKLGPGPYGPLQPPDANGIMLPQGFRSRVIAQGGTPVPGTTYEWPIFGDGAATFPTSDGWIMAVNSEVPNAGGASAIRFRSDGSIQSAYSILSNTRTNCAGGGTPWGTWLSCEEVDDGLVFECDPTGARAAVVRPALGVFKHEAVAVDPVHQRLYLTEDTGDGCLYRFTPAAYPDLTSGLLEVAIVQAGGKVRWERVPDPSARRGPTRQQVAGATRFRRGEGIFFDEGVIYVVTTSDSKVHAYDTRTEVIDVVYDKAALNDAPLIEIDNVCVSPSGDIYVAENDVSTADPLDIGIITPEGEVARFLKCTGAHHGRPQSEAFSELTGVIFDPSGRRMYFSSQRAYFGGLLYEVTGPFRLARVPRPRPAAGGALGIDAPRRIRLRTARARGVPVRLTLDGPGTVTAVLAARFTRGGRRRTYTLARGRLESSSGGMQTLRLRLSRRARTLLRSRRRPLGATLTVTIAGETFRRRVVLSTPRRRRRRSP